MSFFSMILLKRRNTKFRYIVFWKCNSFQIDRVQQTGERISFPILSVLLRTE